MTPARIQREPSLLGLLPQSGLLHPRSSLRLMTA